LAEFLEAGRARLLDGQPNSLSDRRRDERQRLRIRVPHVVWRRRIASASEQCPGSVSDELVPNVSKKSSRLGHALDQENEDRRFALLSASSTLPVRQNLRWDTVSKELNVCVGSFRVPLFLQIVDFCVLVTLRPREPTSTSHSDSPRFFCRFVKPGKRFDSFCSCFCARVSLLIGGFRATRDLPQTGGFRDDLVLGATSLSKAPCGGLLEPISLRRRTAPGNQLPKSSRRERFAELRQDRRIDKLLPTDRAIMMAWRSLYDAAENVEPPDASQQRVRAAGVLLNPAVNPRDWARAHLTDSLHQPVYSI
jgi:hypothetical protein